MISRFFISISIIILILVSNLQIKAQGNHNLDSLIHSSKSLLKQSKPDNSIKLLFNAINSDEINNDTLVLCNILSCRSLPPKT